MAFRQNIIHSIALPRLDKIKKFAPGAKVVLHYHGSDVRNTPPQARRKQEQLADVILLATPDLLDYEYLHEPIWLPNPVDTRLFAPRKIPENGRGLVMTKPHQRVDDTMQRLHDLGHGDISWNIIVRYDDAGRNFPGTMYAQMPSLLEQYQYYAEISWNYYERKWYVDFDSTTGLQALSMGLKLIRSDGTVVDSLPSKHTDVECAKRVQAIYQDIL